VEAASLGLAAVSLGRLDSMDSLDSRRYSVGQGQKDRRLKRASSGTEVRVQTHLVRPIRHFTSVKWGTFFLLSERITDYW
jgi:hypothetical protein